MIEQVRAHVGLAVACLLAGSGCGRYRFDSLPAGPPTDAATLVDATTPAVADADATPDGAVDAAADPDAASGSDAAADAGAPGGYCNALPALAAAPTIDGVLEAGLTLQPIGTDSWDTQLGVPVPADSVVAYALAWRPDGIYAFVSVRGANCLATHPSDAIWCGASTEIYLDDDGAYAVAGKYDAAGTRQLQIAAPASGSASEHRGSTYAPGTGVSTSPWTSGEFAAYPRPDGYDVEAFIGGADLGVGSWALAPAARVGFDIGVNVSVPTTAPGTGEVYDECSTPNRLGQYFLRVDPAPPTTCTSGGPWCDTAAFCTSVLSP